MKRLFLMLSLALVCVSSMAQAVAEGYYRVQNVWSRRYCVLADNKAYIDRSAASAGTGSANLEAIRMYRSSDENNPIEKVISNPASIIKLTYNASAGGYSFGAQGTDTYSILRSHGTYYFNFVKYRNTSYYQLSATGTYQGMSVSIHLSDQVLARNKVPSFNEQFDTLGYMQPTGTYTYWSFFPVDASTDNYFGFQPTLTVGGKNYLPFYASFAFTNYSAGIRAYYVDKVNEANGTAEMREITDVTKPAGVPMIIETASSEPSDNKVNVVDGGTAPTDNKLTGVYFCSAKELLAEYDRPSHDHEVYTLNDPATMRLLAVDNGQLVLKKSSAKFIPANSFYLKVSSSCPDVVRLLNVEDFTTGITTITSDKPANASNDVYNLNGQRVSTTGLDNLPQGIYIYNGKKVVKN